MPTILSKKAGGSGGGGAPSGPAGGDLSGTYPNPTLAANSVETAAIQDDAVTAAKIGVLPACRVRRTTNQLITHNTLTIQTFDSEVFDTDSMHSTVTETGRITFNTAGIYLITGTVFWDTDVDGVRQLNILQDDTTILARDLVEAVETGADGTAQQVTTLAAFTAGQWVELQIFHTAGGDLNSLSVGVESPVFSAVWTGPAS